MGEIADRGIDPRGDPRVFKSSNPRYRSGRSVWEHSTAIEPHGWLCERPHRRPLISTVCQVTHTIGANGVATVPALRAFRCPKGCRIGGHLHPTPVACLPIVDSDGVAAGRKTSICDHGRERTNRTPVYGETSMVHDRSQAGFGAPRPPQSQRFAAPTHLNSSTNCE